MTDAGRLDERLGLDRYIPQIYDTRMTSEYPGFSGFEWDGGNRDKNLKRKVQWWECEQLFFNRPLIVLEDAFHSVSESRFAAFGRTDAGRALVVGFTMRHDQLRVISSRDMSGKERTFYESNSKE